MGKPRKVIDINYHIANWLKREEKHKEQKPSNKWISTLDGFSICAQDKQPDKAFVGDCWLKMYHRINKLFEIINFGSLKFCGSAN